jgi:hypothetical protein
MDDSGGSSKEQNVNRKEKVNIRLAKLQMGIRIPLIIGLQVMHITFWQRICLHLLP